MKTPSNFADSSVLRVFMPKTKLSMSWYRMNGTHWRWINVTCEGNTIIYSTRVNIVRKLPLSSMVITKQEEDSRVQHRSGPFNAWKLQKERFEAWLGRMSWGQKAEACQRNCSGRTKLIYFYPGAMVWNMVDWVIFTTFYYEWIWNAAKNGRKIFIAAGLV